MMQPNQRWASTVCTEQHNQRWEYSPYTVCTEQPNQRWASTVCMMQPNQRWASTVCTEQPNQRWASLKKGTMKTITLQITRTIKL